MPILDNISIIDLTQALAGPYCTMLLGDMGADVIKVEQPSSGDQSRSWGPPFVEGESTYFLAVNRNKKSLTLNLKSDAGQEIMQRLIQRADVFITNLPRQSSRCSTGVDSQTLLELNPGLIYVSITGYGMTGPYAERPGYDLIAQGESGLMSITGEPDGQPMRYPIPLSDMTTGMYAAMGILGALLARQQTGRGQVIDLSLLESQSAWLGILASAYLNAGEAPRRLGNTHPSIVPYQVFQARDKHIIVAVGTSRLWTRFCEVLGIADTVMNDPRFATNSDRLAHRGELIALVQDILAGREADYWLEALREAQIPSGPINAVPETLTHPQLLERGFIVEQEHPLAGLVKSLANPIHFSETPASYRSAAPALGEHNQVILQGLGYTSQKIKEFMEKGIV
jgi:crotonobetainyl-CoA:carnitine CoA-transferase CaiB-like acyl-CoA transferase